MNFVRTGISYLILDTYVQTVIGRQTTKSIQQKGSKASSLLHTQAAYYTLYQY